jgi:hypothetical protein
MGNLKRAQLVIILLTAVLSLLAACTSASRARTSRSTPPTTSSGISTATKAGTAGTTMPVQRLTPAGADGVPRFDHIVVVVEENKPYGELVGTRSTPFLTALAGRGAVLTESYAITHPSQPNYLALFSGSTHGISSDSCPHHFTGPNLAASLIAAGDEFVGYAESLPSPGYTGCSAGPYARKHAPWLNFTLPASTSQPMTAFPTSLAHLPGLSFVIPNLQNDMHDGSIAQGDRWLSTHLGGYATWAASHNSLLVVTTDEDDKSHANHITTIFAGAHVRPGKFATRVDHFGILHTLLDSFNLAPFAGAATAPAITTIWAR